MAITQVIETVAEKLVDHVCDGGWFGPSWHLHIKEARGLSHFDLKEAMEIAEDLFFDRTGKTLDAISQRNLEAYEG